MPLEMNCGGAWAGGVIASPLYVDGLVYLASEGGRLGVYDAQNGKPVYQYQLDTCPRWQYVGGPALTASPALAGKNIYVLDGSGVTCIVQPGRTFKQIGRNIIPNCGQTLGPPSFEGSRIYLRTAEKLYCIGEN
jgi:outer membrane protein assembly factor BamB